MKANKSSLLIFAALILGILVGYVCNQAAPTPEAAKEIAGYFGIITDIFLRLIKMIIAPLVFATLVSGLANIGDSKTVGRIGSKALGWFIAASLVSLTVGLLFANLLQPGHALNMALPEAGAATNLKTGALNLKDFITHVFPKSIVEAMAGNSVLQILVFSVFFGLALGNLHSQAARSLVQTMDEVVHVMLKVTDYVMRFAPLGVFAAVAAVVTTQGLGMLSVFGKLLASFYIALAVLWTILIGAGYTVLGRDVFRLIKLVRSPMLLGFSTASSESAYPKLMEQLEKFGVKNRITGFVLPLGYSFNLDGSMLYTGFAALFVAQEPLTRLFGRLLPSGAAAQQRAVGDCGPVLQGHRACRPRAARDRAHAGRGAHPNLRHRHRALRSRSRTTVRHQYRQVSVHRNAWRCLHRMEWQGPRRSQPVRALRSCHRRHPGQHEGLLPPALRPHR